MVSASSPTSEPLLALTRQDAYLQAHLQRLLDAQSEGLLAGLGAAPNDNISSAGSRTPTTNASESELNLFVKPRSVVPVRQPLPKKIGLRGARRGIAKTINDLASLKDEEGRVLQQAMAQREDILSSVKKIAAKTTGLQEQINTIESESSTARISGLKTTEKALDDEIHELETRLYEMKARQRHLLRDIQSLENSVQSKLSSYKNALQLAEKETRDFLARPPLQDDTSRAKGIWALPLQRRTLEMAQEQYMDEQEAFRGQAEKAKRERDALVEGARSWDHVVVEVAEVEKMLHVEMKKSNDPRDGMQAQDGMKNILERMSKARIQVQDDLDKAKERDWKLLVCCIGAELEALAEGEDVLKEALEASNEHLATQTSGEQMIDVYDDHGPRPPGINNDSGNGSEEEDDGPGPDLLVSQDDV